MVPTRRRGLNARSIPARAGEPSDRPADRAVMHGLSPRERGNRTDRLPREVRVYPRASGGTSLHLRAAMNLHAGLSPRERGNLGPTVRPTAACQGLSPRERGNLRSAKTNSTRRRGSIPARAGEPSTVPASGGRSLGSIPARAGEPLLACASRVDRLPGSIPARAGEPHADWQTTQPHGSIPARAGEPGESRSAPRLSQGLSPRERGNPLRNISLQRGAAGPQRTSIPSPSRGRLLAPRRCARLAPHQIYAVGIHNCLGSLAECSYSLFPYRCGISPGHHN